jgi:branched-chain amino acid transport system substrate-binding protein
VEEVATVLMNGRFRGVCGVLLLTVITACGSSSQSNSPSGPLKIAAVISLSGKASVFGAIDHQSMQLAVDDVNASGGISGRKLQIDFLDDASAPDVATTVSQQAASDPDVIAVAGAGSTAATVQPNLNILNRVGVPTMDLTGSQTKSADPGHWTFRLGVAYDSSGLATMSFIHDYLPNVSKFGLEYETGPFGQGYLDSMKNGASQFGLQLADAEAVQPNATDELPQMRRLLAAGSQAIVLVKNTSLSVPINNWASLGYPVPVIGSLGYATAASVSVAEDASRHITAIPAYVLATSPLPRQKALVGQYQKAYGTLPPSQAARGWDAVHILAKVLRAGNVTRSSIRTALETITNYQGAGGVFTFSPSNHQGYNESDLIWIHYSGNGNYAYYGPWAAKHGV